MDLSYLSHILDKVKVAIGMSDMAKELERQYYHRDGYGEIKYPSGLDYRGYFREGKFHGEGTAIYPDGSQYYGMWYNGLPHGPGTYLNKKGRTDKVGYWKEGKLVVEDPNAASAY